MSFITVIDIVYYFCGKSVTDEQCHAKLKEINLKV